MATINSLFGSRFLVGTHFYHWSTREPAHIGKKISSYNVAMQSFPKIESLIPEFCTGYRNEALKPLCLKRSWSNFDPQAYCLYGEDQN